MAHVLLAALLAALPLSAAYADTVTRCTGPAGQITFSNQGCAKGERIETVELKPLPTTDSGGLRDWAKRSPPARASAERPKPPAEPRATRVRDVVACENARRDYRFEAGNQNGRRGRMGALREEVRQACGGR